MKAAWAKRKAEAKALDEDSVYATRILTHDTAANDDAIEAAWQREADAIEADLKTAEDTARGRDINVKMELSDGFKEVQRLENELRRRDKEIIADFVYCVGQVRLARDKFDPTCRAISVSDSTIDAILRTLPTE